jgi:predicted DNA-binding protein with PD1-like motif
MRANAIRLTPGIDLKVELERLPEEHDLRAGCTLSRVGSLSRARLRMPRAPGRAHLKATRQRRRCVSIF